MEGPDNGHQVKCMRADRLVKYQPDHNQTYQMIIAILLFLQEKYHEECLGRLKNAQIQKLVTLQWSIVGND